MFDPIDKAKEVAEAVADGELRRYRRFRPARFYGGIATADCVGCCLRCVFCWSWPQLKNPQTSGRLYTPREAAERLVAVARRKGFERVRVSGHEPTLCRAHLLGVLERIPQDLPFTLETNGILLGAHPSYAEELARFRNLYVRVSFKGTNKDEFSRLTEAHGSGFDLQLSAVENLHLAGVRVQPAVMVSFSTDENVEALVGTLGSIAPHLADIEVEELVLYGKVRDRLKRKGIQYREAYDPRSIPEDQV